MNRPRRRTPQIPLKITYSAISGLLYIGLGTACFINVKVQNSLGTAAYIVGGSTLVYGIFRLINAWIQYKSYRRDLREIDRVE